MHHVDLCQALSVGPERKYQDQGGPGVASVASLLDETADSPSKSIEFRFSFSSMAIFNHLSGRQRFEKNAMRSGQHEHVARVAETHWAQFARDVGLPGDVIRDLRGQSAEALPGTRLPCPLNQLVRTRASATSVRSVPFGWRPCSRPSGGPICVPHPSGLGVCGAPQNLRVGVLKLEKVVASTNRRKV